MKQRFYMLLAVLVLSFVGAFAQSRTPLKGDVNEDGVVDVADIVAVINIIKNGQDPNTTVYEYLLTNELPTEIPTFSKAYTDSMKLDALEGFSAWAGHKPQYIVFPKMNNATSVSDYFTLTGMFGDNLTELFTIIETSVSGIIVIKWNGRSALSEDDGNADTINLK